MNLFEKLLYFLQGEMTEPTAFGWFHVLWLVLVIISVYILFKRKKYYSEKQLKIVLGVYGVIALILELLKQLIWTFNYDPISGITTWDYEWYAFPFQLCTTPIFISIICLFLKKGKVRNSLLSYMAYITILGSISTMLIPESCFVSDILVNIHTMWLHLGSFVVSVYLLMSGEVKINIQSLKQSIKVFLIFVTIAGIMNILVYNIGILNGETFNMFYISPYFISTLPVFNVIQENVPYVVYLIIYIWVLILGSLVIYFISYLIRYLSNKKAGVYEKDSIKSN
ncbi:MAG: YwaF family protein [Bacilli bacterium]|nr:YwaF family protein [Bacilli bacterium]MBQ7031304.1 YwaF family protein [Bacilli bacterium]MBQ7140928.1 YwaF family protein [Bacilli bacterium]